MPDNVSLKAKALPWKKSVGCLVLNGARHLYPTMKTFAAISAPTSGTVSETPVKISVILERKDLLVRLVEGIIYE
jgi:hypothetical protein